ncbi:FAD-dependent oxidoreductase [Aspergillus mulundensis]|uniref:FAD dependent oxidoreductase domain-containing protein n=1 Tax=Aspergillus mulundensis TaxID=1810919 RepID=A0A3D8R0C0_9EURO|nr:hypothetical protein DSM5745_09353 [Aspergillus mulundensis]RDW67487.1 hypothetical protein DSM5745_09353 [Aspergillus mulundensis]
MISIAIIGGGWSGCHTALELANAGHHVTIIEKGSELFNGVSGQFGIRIHKGPHYPRSSGTRDSCRRTFESFCLKYPEIVVPVEPAIYALAGKDSMGRESKVDAETFGDVCRESKECLPVDIAHCWPGSELEVAYKLDEPCAVLNPYLKHYFREKLSSAGISIRLNDEVTGVRRVGDRYCISTSTRDGAWFGKVINATGYASALPDGLLSNLPIKLNIQYQACTALSYTDSTPGQSPISFIVMDGWFPCLMPCLSDPKKVGDYVLTHGAYTILGSYDTPAEAGACLSGLAPDFMEGQVRPKLEEQMERFWPGFTKRFHYTGWKGSVLPKMVTDTEFRSSVVFEADGVVYIFPGKISNVVDAAEEVFALIDGSEAKVIRTDGYGYARDSELSRSRKEIEMLPLAKDRNTCFLQTHRELCIKA